VTEEEVHLRISKEKVRRMCKSSSHASPGSLFVHTKEVFSDGWTRYVCNTCGQVKFTMGEEEE